MKTYKITITIKGPLGTPIQGDTLWGHLCWAIRLRDGEEALKDFLDQYNHAEPPVIFSDAFPKGYLPKPMLLPPISEETSLENYADNKALKKQNLVPDYLFNNKEVFNLGTIRKEKIDEENKITTENRIHNTINRLSGTVLNETGLFTTKELFYKTPSMEIYVLTTFPKNYITDLLQLLFEGGYGADVSSGKGHIIFKEITEVDFPREGNRYMTLGSFVCTGAHKIYDLRADTLTKRGKVGNIFTHLLNPPFKVPIIMYKTGSTFESTDDLLYIGEMLAQVHRDPRIRHLAMAPVIKYKEEEGI